MYQSRKQLEALGEPIGDMTLPKIGGGYVCHGGGKGGSSPPPPDYMGAALATAQGNADAARVAASANRVNQYTPYGTMIYERIPGSFDQAAYQAAMKEWQEEGGNLKKKPSMEAFGNPDAWQVTQNLSPEQQQLLQYQNQTSLGLGQLSGKGLEYVSSMMDQPFDTSRLPAEQINPGQTAQQAIMARLDPKFGQTEEALRTRLANQGIAAGTEAWGNEMRGFNEAKNDAYIQAALQGMNIGQQARQQALQEQAYLRAEPLNTLNAVRTGAQVTNPTFSNVPQQATTQGPDIMGATQNQYNAQMGQYNAGQAANAGMLGGLFSLGGAALGSPWVGRLFG